MMDIKVVKVIGIAASVLGAAATLVANWAGDKQMDATITEKVAKAVENLAKKES